MTDLKTRQRLGKIPNRFLTFSMMIFLHSFFKIFEKKDSSRVCFIEKKYHLRQKRRESLWCKNCRAWFMYRRQIAFFLEFNI